MLREDEPRLSPEMAAAQEKLLAMRQALGSAPASPDLTGATPARSRRDRPDAAAPNWPLRNAQAELARRRAELGVATKTWPPDARPVFSEQGDNTAMACRTTTADCIPPDHPAAVLPPSPQPPGPNPIPRVFTAHPSLLMAVLRQKREAAGRVWFLLRLADSDGRGWLTADEVRAALS